MSARYNTASPAGIFKNPGATIALTGAHTIACWAFPTVSAGTIVEVIELQDSVTANYASIIEYGGGTAQFTFSEQDAAAANALQLTAAAAINTWHHVALVYNGANSITAYLNGAAVGTDSTPTLGARNNWSSMQTGPYDGDCSDAVFYNAALTADEILALYRERLPRRRTNLVCHWPHFAGANRIVDYSGNANNGTEFGVPTDGDNPPAKWSGNSPQRVYIVSSAITIVPTGTTNVTGAAAMTKAAGLAPAGTVQTTGAAAVTSGASAASSGSTQVTGAAAMTKAAGLVPAGTTQVTGAAVVTATFPIAATGLTQTTGAAALAGALSCAGSTQCTGTAALTATAALVATGVTQVNGAAAFSGGGAGGGRQGATGAAFRRQSMTTGRRRIR